MVHQSWVLSNLTNNLLDAKVIHSSHSIRSTLINIVPKGDGGKCLIIDYRALNKITQKSIWPMPKVEDVFSKFNSAKYFSTLNIHARDYHITLYEYSIPKTAFTLPFRQYEYLKAPFRLAQAPAHFSLLCQKIQYFSHNLSTTGIKVLPSKMEAIKIMQQPENTKQVGASLGLVGYNQKFIKNSAQITKPLTTLFAS